MKKEIFSNFKKKHILIIGDLGLDSYISGTVKRISPEAPVPIVEYLESYDRLGLSANVASNVVSLGGKASIIGVTGKDENAKILNKMMREQRINTDGIVIDESRYTTHKLRVLASKLHHVVRIDKENKKVLSHDIKKELLEKIKSKIDEADIIVLEDYGKGLFKDDLISKIIEIAKRHSKEVFIDPSRYTKVGAYKGATLLKPNLDELEILSGEIFEPDSEIDQISKKVFDMLSLEYLIVTMGKKGMKIFDNKGVKTIPSYPVEVFDVSGAGDTVIATLALCRSIGLDIEKSAKLASAAAAIVVSKTGTSVVSAEEILNFMEGKDF
jgi:rfaE bifunctional protein kinase chain/domain